MGLKDFVKHVYSYFNVPDVTNTTPSEPPITRQPGRVSLEGYLPMYDGDGNLKGYIAAGPRSSTVSQAAGVPSIRSAPQASPDIQSSVAKTSPHQILYVKSPNGEFIPITPSTVQDPGANLPPTAPSLIQNTPVQPVSLSNPKPLEIKGRKIGNGATRWDGWPDGGFEADFTWPEFTETLNLRCHWAVIVGGGDRKGNRHALTWEQGKKSTRSCLGILLCENPVCNVIIRPNVKPASLDAQLRSPCHCGAVLVHERCEIRSFLWQWSGGVHYSNGGYHVHRRPTHLLHILPGERCRFEDIVKSNPQAGPLQLVVGVQGINGPGESVADISPVLLNQHRVGKECLKVKKGEFQDGDALISAFADFDKKCPGFVIHSVFGAETVISVQSDFMRSQLVKNSVLDGPVNGLVSDGAHGWWKVRESILIVSSTYCPVLLCWVPGVLSYSNGSSARHFMYHFVAVLQSIAREAESRSMDVTDELFAGIMDFSQAERLGFIKAFIQFWNTRPGNIRLVPELENAAEKLLKGCLQHFQAAVTRICRMTGVIPPESVEDFRARAHGLVHCKTSEIFIQQCALLVQDFPNLRDWIEWWARPSHASMLFESERIMDIELWDSIPDTTNAEESMHWKLYSMANRNHAFLNGMYSLHGVACHFERLYEAKLKGIPIRYGQRGRIMNWFETNISKDKSLAVRNMWMGPLLPLAHTYTLFILAGVTRDDLVLIRRKREKLEKKLKKAEAAKNGNGNEEVDPDCLASEISSDNADDSPSAKQLEKESTWTFSREDYLDEAWRRQRCEPFKQGVDVAKECLQRLEEEMFENSMRAGAAGNEQWGLDVGPSQRGFYPFANLPADLTDGKRLGDEYIHELEPGPNYKEDPAPVEVTKERPKPKMITRKLRSTDSKI